MTFKIHFYFIHKSLELQLPLQSIINLYIFWMYHWKIKPECSCFLMSDVFQIFLLFASFLFDQKYFDEIYRIYRCFDTFEDRIDILVDRFRSRNRNRYSIDGLEMECLLRIKIGIVEKTMEPSLWEIKQVSIGLPVHRDSDILLDALFIDWISNIIIRIIDKRKQSTKGLISSIFNLFAHSLII